MDAAHCKIKNKTLKCEYLFYLFSSKFFHKSIFSFSAGTTVLHLNLTSVKKILIPIPSISEQIKIASILSGVDAYIQKNQEYKKKLERLKKGLMQKLLTGQIRVKV